MSLYTVEIGGYAFALAPATAIETERVVRPTSPNEAVAVNHTFRLACRVRADTPAAVTTAFLAAVNSWLYTRTCPRFRLKDEAGAVISPYDVDEDRSPTLNWEDVRLEACDLPAGDGQLVSGATFTLVLRARRSLPDADGICEFDAQEDHENDEFDNQVLRRTVRFRWAKASVVEMEDASSAVQDRLRVDGEVGWVRTVGGSDLGFIFRYPLYPEFHVVETVSEIRTSSGVSGASGATRATTGTRTTVDPAKGLRRITQTAETSGAGDPEGWVQDQQPSAEYVSHDVSVEIGTVRSARAEWTRVEAFRANGKTTDVTRTYAVSGGLRTGDSVEMTPPYRPKIQRGPFTAYRITETVEVRALGATALSDFAVPDPLGVPFVLVEEDAALPRVEEQAIDPAQRLWLWVVTRTYLWDSEDDPKSHQALAAAVFSDALEEGS